MRRTSLKYILSFKTIVENIEGGMSQEVWDKTVSDVNDGILVGENKPHPSFYVALTVSIICLIIGALAWVSNCSWNRNVRTQ